MRGGGAWFPLITWYLSGLILLTAGQGQHWEWKVGTRLPNGTGRMIPARGVSPSMTLGLPSYPTLILSSYPTLGLSSYLPLELPSYPPCTVRIKLQATKERLQRVSSDMVPERLSMLNCIFHGMTIFWYCFQYQFYKLNSPKKLTNSTSWNRITLYG